MTIRTEAHFPCPGCGAPAHVGIEWHTAGDGTPDQGDVVAFSCPAGCPVDDVVLRRIVGMRDGTNHTP